MAEEYRISNLTEALNLARHFKVSGKYDLFRGQGQNWEVIPTMGRLDKSGLKKVKEKLERLHYYLQTHKPLEKFVSDIDWFYAVAQHYGLPTSYIDFSTSVKVAAFFATNSKSNKVGQDCVIICLRENDFSKFVEFTKSIYENDKVVPPYIAKPNVDNLWRLQAQQGCFLFTPYFDIEFFYNFDKIIFPFTEPYKNISIESIYPKRKSELEILLDQYFNAEKRLEGYRRFKKFVEENKIERYVLPIIEFDSLLKQKTPHDSWKSSSYEEWLYKVNEEWKDVLYTNTLDIHFDLKNSINVQIQEIVNELSTAFSVKCIDRNSPVRFEIIAKPRLTNKLTRIISNSCVRIWDGTRNLPFSDSEIQNIIAQYVCLEIYENKFDKTPSLTEEELITIELKNEYGSITRCYASPSKIVSSFRNDIKDVLVDKITDNISSEILLQVNEPSILFDFHKLIELFKSEIIAYQVLYNSENTNPVIFYTPTQVTVLGYA